MKRTPILGQSDEAAPGDEPVTPIQAIVWTVSAVAWVILINAILPVVPQ